MRRPAWPAWATATAVLGIGLLSPGQGEAQVRRMSGNLRVSYRFDEQRTGGSATQRSDLRHDYSLGVQGIALDPRLATFDLTGTFGANDPLQGKAEESRMVSGGMNLNVLPTSRIPVSLRHVQSHGWNGTTSDVSNTGLTWGVSHPSYPSLSLNLERTAVEARGLSPSDTSFLGGRLQATHRLEALDLFGEVGVRRTEESLRDITTLSQFANFSGSYKATAATNVQGAATYFQQGDNLSGGINASLTHRADPSLTRSANLGFRVTQGAGATTYNLDAAGSLSKSYVLSPALKAFLTGGASFAADIVGEGSGEGFWSLTGSGGGGITYSGFRYVGVALDSNLSTLYEDDQNRGAGVRGSAHVGLTGQNLGPLTLGVDYTFRAETGVVNARDHTLSLRGNLGIPIPIGPTLKVEAFVESGSLFQEGGRAAAQSSSQAFAGGGRVVFTGIPLVTWNVQSQYRVTKSGLFDTETLMTSSILTYTPFRRFQAMLTATREDALTSKETRHSVQADLSYRIGVTSLSLVYGFDMLGGRSQQPIFQRLMVTLSRPFAFGVR